MALTAGDIYTRFRQLLPEMLRFGLVGGVGAVFDLGGAAVLHGSYGVSALMAKGISTTVAMVITYVFSRFWTFKDGDSQSVRRQVVYFVVLNLVGLLIAEVVVGLVTDVAGLHGEVAFNLASFFGTGLGTIFRYITYRKWVFIPDPARSPVPASATAPFAPWGREVAPAAAAPREPAVALPPFNFWEPAPGPASGAPWEPAVAPAAVNGDRQLAPAMSRGTPEPQSGPWIPPAAPRPPTHRPTQPQRPAHRSSGRHRKN